MRKKGDVRMMRLCITDKHVHLLQKEGTAQARALRASFPSILFVACSEPATKHFPNPNLKRIDQMPQERVGQVPQDSAPQGCLKHSACLHSTETINLKC